MRQLAIVTLLLVAAAITWYFADFGTAPATGDAPPVQTGEPDVFGKDIELMQFNADGSLHYRLNASAIRQFNVEELTRMTAPTLHLISPGQAPWDISSMQGYIRKRRNAQGQPEEVVYLREDVRMVQVHHRGGPVTLRSEAFYVYPDRQYAETDQDVMIDTNVGRTKAGGLRADMQSGRLELSSGQKLRVHTIVLPEQFKKT